MTIKKNKRSQQGMTLIEVLAALAIVAIALMAVIQTTGMSTRQLTRVQDVAQAYWVSKNAALRLQLNIEFNTGGVGAWQGVDTFMGRSFYWSAKSTKVPERALIEIEVTTSFKQGDPMLNKFTSYVPMRWVELSR